MAAPSASSTRRTVLAASRRCRADGGGVQSVSADLLTEHDDLGVLVRLGPTARDNEAEEPAQAEVERERTTADDTHCRSEVPAHRLDRDLGALHPKEWAAPLLQTAYAPYFRVRIEEVLRARGSVGFRLCDGDIEACGQAVTKMRNAIIHPPTTGSGTNLESHDQSWVGSPLYWLAHCCLVRKLGMSEDDLDKRLDTLPGAHEVEASMRERFSP